MEASLTDLIQSVKTQGVEGLVAKDLNSVYEPGPRSGAWRKMRINKGQEFVIGGYTIDGNSFDALILGYYEEDSSYTSLGHAMDSLQLPGSSWRGGSNRW